MAFIRNRVRHNAGSFTHRRTIFLNDDQVIARILLNQGCCEPYALSTVAVVILKDGHDYYRHIYIDIQTSI